MSVDFSYLQKLPMRKALIGYKEIISNFQGKPEYWIVVAELAKQDRFFLLTHLLHRTDAVNEWLYEQCREVEANPDGYLDLWARFHYKSTLITFAGSIQEIIRNPEITICILSYNNATASSFLGQIKRELESNEDLQRAFPDIFYENPKRESQSWSMDKGLLVKRKSNPKEATLEAYGLVDNQPTGRHFLLRIYDDVVTRESVTTPDMIRKVTENWELSLNLGASKHGNRQWYCGTRYSANDTYQTIINRQYLKQRIKPATDDGTPDGTPIFMDIDEWEDLKKGTSEYVLACQQLLNPMAGSLQEFKPEWVRRWEVRPPNLNVYILCDPASSKKGSACNTAMIVLGVDSHFNKYMLDGMCHKMNLNERWENLRNLRNKWVKAPGIQGVSVGYEKYGMQADIEYFQQMMRIDNSYFNIEIVSWTRDGLQAKDDRIRRLIPDHQNWRFFYPETRKVTKRMSEAIENGDALLVAKPIKRKNSEGKVYELTEWFLRNEFPFFPNSQVKDMLDAMSRLYDMDVNPPVEYGSQRMAPDDFMNIGPSYYNGELMEPEQSWTN